MPGTEARNRGQEPPSDEAIGLLVRFLHHAVFWSVHFPTDTREHVRALISWVEAWGDAAAAEGA